MRRTRRRAAFATSLLVGCGQPTQPPTQPPTETTRPELRKDHAVELARLLAVDAVYHDKFARRTLYSWTTTEQIEELRKTKRLLVRDESPKHGASYVDQVLYALSLHGDPVAQKIYTAGFAKMRFAWPSMWATRAGWPNEQYGDQIVRITLKADAWIAYLSTATGTIVVHDMNDKPIPTDAVVAKPERIAAIYFVSDASVPPAPGIPRPEASFREYAMCNESMIEWYEVGTARLRGEVDQAIALAESLVDWVTHEKVANDQPTAKAWLAPASNRLVALGAYRAALALDSPHYRLVPTEMKELVTKLRSTPIPMDAAGVKHAPTVVFTIGPGRNPPRVVGNYNLSFARPASITSARP